MSEEKKALDVQTAKRRLEVLGKAMAKARMEATKATEADMDKAERFEGKEDLVRYEFESPLAKSPLAQTVDKTLQDINGVFKKHRVLKWISVLGVSALAYAPYEYQRYQKTGKTLMVRFAIDFLINFFRYLIFFSSSHSHFLAVFFFFVDTGSMAATSSILARRPIDTVSRRSRLKNSSKLNAHCMDRNRERKNRIFIPKTTVQVLDTSSSRLYTHKKHTNCILYPPRSTCAISWARNCRAGR